MEQSVEQLSNMNGDPSPQECSCLKSMFEQRSKMNGDSPPEECREDWHEQATVTHDRRGLVRDDRPPLTMAGHEGLNDQDGTSQPLQPKPLCVPQDSPEIRQKVMGVQNLVRDRLATLKQRARDISRGSKPVGVRAWFACINADR